MNQNTFVKNISCNRRSEFDGRKCNLRQELKNCKCQCGCKKTSKTFIS